MALKSLNQLRRFRNALLRGRERWLQARLGVVFGSGVSISLAARFISGTPGDIVVGSETLIAFKTLLLAHDIASGKSAGIRIGSRCFIGGGSVIMPGVTIGDESIVGGGSVVFEDVPARSIVTGNPARILRSDIEVGAFGRLKVAGENTQRLYYA
jgi:acetyltransferase-like isoleucine patch superfamily enzyme